MNNELTRLKGSIHGGSGQVYLVTTGRGRQKVAHLPSGEEGKRVACNKCKDGNLRRVDCKTVEKFYQKCSDCTRLEQER